MEKKLNLKEITERLEREVFKICIIGKNFISLGVPDARGQHGWRVKMIYKHNLKTIPIDLVAKYQMEKIIFTEAKI
jgi:hypothetical protein